MELLAQMKLSSLSPSVTAVWLQLKKEEFTTNAEGKSQSNKLNINTTIQAITTPSLRIFSISYFNPASDNSFLPKEEDNKLKRRDRDNNKDSITNKTITSNKDNSKSNKA